MKLRVLDTTDLEQIVREEFSNRIPGNLHAYLLTFNMICKKHKLAVVQADDYDALLQTLEIETE